MPHSVAMAIKYPRRIAAWETAACADSGASACCGVAARNPKYPKISRIESVCHGEAMKRRLAGSGREPGPAGSRFIRAPTIKLDTPARKNNYAEISQGSQINR